MPNSPSPTMMSITVPGSGTPLSTAAAGLTLGPVGGHEARIMPQGSASLDDSNSLQRGTLSPADASDAQQTTMSVTVPDSGTPLSAAAAGLTLGPVAVMKL